MPLFGKTKKLETEITRLEKILDAVDQPVWRRDANLKIVFANYKYRELAEVPSGFSDITELDKDVKKLASLALEKGEAQCNRMKIISGGKRLEYNICEKPFENGTLGYALAAKELAEVEEKLKSYQDVQEQLLETSASAIAIYGPDQKLKFFNNAFINLWKLEESWLGTEPTYAEVLETLREKRRLPEQADFRSFKQENLKMFNGLLQTKEEFYFLPNEQSLRVIVIPHALGGLQFVYEDMSDRLALERSYNTLLAVQSETLSNLQEGVAVFGESGKLTLSNSVYAKLWQLDESFLKSEPFISDILDRCKELFNYEGIWEDFKSTNIINSLSRESLLYNHELKDGRIIEVKKTPLPDGEVLLTFNDITASALVEKSLRERTEALEDVDKMKTEFLTNVSYELRSPLTSIIGFSEILRQELFGELNKKQKAYLDDVFKSSRQLESLINDILDISSIEAGYMKLNIDIFDIHAMLATVISLVQERVREGGLNLEFDCATNIGRMYADETRIKQVIFNIISNSLKFTRTGGNLTLGTKQADNDKIMIWIEDTGTGISQANLKNVFNKFEKSKLKGGTGLGLSVAKNLIELHGGTVEIQSEEGKGTKVICILPRDCRNSMAIKQDLLDKVS